MTTKLTKMPNTKLISERELNIFILFFSDTYRHIQIEQIDREKIKNFLSEPYMMKSSTTRKMAMFSDFCMAQNMCDIIE
tara:strand:+ start:13845 stop:14081 length:237 start_codon:yes stop_codon:yes gene_type:complete